MLWPLNYLRIHVNLKIKQIESDKLRELDRLKTHFFTNISHEFRTPLSLISGMAEKLSGQDSSQARQADYKLIARNASRLLELINQLLDLSKLEAGRLVLHPQPGDILQDLELLLGSFSSLFASKHIHYRYHLPEATRYACYDRDALQKIFSNLLSNAYKFTPPQGQVSVWVEALDQSLAKGSLQVKVQDSGIGIASTALPHIFERFHQEDSSETRLYAGTGIGLALVKELLDLHGGQIRVDSNPGEGTLFTVHLPLEWLSAEQMTNVENGTPLSPVRHEQQTSWVSIASGNPPVTGVQLLLVEDQADLRTFIKDCLSRNYQVIEASDGLQGYQKALEEMPDLIISDVMMPGMDGITLCDRLKTQERTSHIPILLLTAKADLESKLKGLGTGADEYLTKPFHLQELQLRIKNLMDNRQKLKDYFCKQLIAPKNNTFRLEPTPVRVSSVEEKFLQRAVVIVETHMATADFDVESFSKEIGMSRAHLHRKLTVLCGQSAGEFIKLIRLKRAASLLVQQHGNISEIAYEVGFSSLNYFTKCFKESYGQTPSEYMHTNRTSRVNP